MKRNKVIAALLILILVTVSSYSLAKFYDKRTYVIQIDNAAFGDKSKSVQEKSEK